MLRRHAIVLWLGLLFAPALFAGDAQAQTNDDAVKRAMKDEMARTIDLLHVAGAASPYYARYTIVDVDHSFVSARLGSIVEDNHNPSRVLHVDTRVGSPDEDNTNSRELTTGSAAVVTSEDNYYVLRRDLWMLSDRDYKRSIETLAHKKASHAVQTAEKDKVPDFAKAPSIELTTSHATAMLSADRAKLVRLVVKLSAAFLDFPTLNNAYADGTADTLRRRLLTSEKTWTDERRSYVHIDIHASTIAEDGQPLSDALSFTSSDVAGLPPLEKMEADVRAMAKTLADQRKAPEVLAGSATVLFEGEAAPALSRLLLASSLSGQPIPRHANEGAHDGSMSLADKLGLVIAPKWLNVVDDPTALGPGKRLLAGGYDSDDEGVAAERVTLIDHGVLKGLYMSRSPRKEIERSNGHGRRSLGIRASAANLFVTADNGLSRAQLLALAVRSAGPKGTVYVVRELGEMSGIGRGQTIQAREATLYKDGKEEIVRGLSLEGFVPKKMKKDLIGAGKEPFVLDDATLGVLTSVVSPALLFEDVDVGRPNDKNKTPPLYPSPLAARGR